MIRPTLLALAAALVLAPASPAAAAPHRCAARHGEHVAAHGARLVALMSVTDTGDFDSVQKLVACDRRTGRRTTIDTETSELGDDTRIDSVRVAGLRAAWIASSEDKYANASRELGLADVATGWTGFVLDPMFHRSSWDLGPGGEVAWIGDGRVTVWRPGPHVRLQPGDRRFAGRGAALAHVTLDATRVRWTDGGEARSAPLKVPPSSCPTQGLGTADVELLDGAVCWRPTGLVTPVEASSGTDVDGPFTVDIPRDADGAPTLVVRHDARDGAALSVPADTPSDAQVSPSGALAWVRSWPTSRDIWVHDGAGTHTVGHTGPRALPVLDGETLSWAPGKGRVQTYTFVPRAS
jgi:hypothetical protein